MYANSRAYKNLKSTKMNTKNTTPNFKLLAIGIVAISFFVTSCTSLQQTTVIASDDLYYTPSKPAEQVVAQAEEETYQDYQNYQDDRYLRLKVANRNRWSSIDDFGYWNNPSFSIGFGMGYGGFGGFGYGGGWDPFWNNRFGWAGYYGGFGGFGYGGFGGFGYDPFWGGGFGGLADLVMTLSGVVDLADLVMAGLVTADGTPTMLACGILMEITMVASTEASMVVYQ